MKVGENIKQFRDLLDGTGCRLVAISKTKTIAEILEAYQAGQRIFGENKVQELLEKYENLPGDIEWHMVGHLQTNKVKYIISFISLIHSADSWKLMKEIDKQAKKYDKIIDCLLQVHIAEEETKFGFSREEILDIFENQPVEELSHIRVCGLMGMATFTENMDQVRKEFKFLKALLEELSSKFDLSNVFMEELSMGMSSDYLIALEEGSTLIRVGTAVFGDRDYGKKD